MRVLAVTSAPRSTRTLSLYLSRTHIHTASVIADPCKLYTVAVWLCAAKSTRLFHQCAMYMGDGHVHGTYTPKW